MEPAVRRRVLGFLVVVVALAAGVGARLVHLQVYERERLREKANSQHWRKVEVPATRGAILDRHGLELALSLQTESLYAHPGRVTDPERAARLLEPIVGPSRAEILELLQPTRSFVYIDRFLEPQAAEAASALDLPIGEGEPFGFLPSSKRYYPRGRLAVHVLGFANIDGEGVEGIEKQFEYELAGDPTVYLVLQDGLSGHVRQRPLVVPDKRPDDVILSIDAVLQHVVERELDRALRDSRARAASGILIDPATGEILALANRPAADPNDYGRATDAERINRAVVYQYEPGSTFKVVSMAAALERGKVHPDQLVDCENGTYRYRNRLIRDIAGYGLLTATRAFEKSSNIGLVKIVAPLGPHDLHDTITGFGFGSRTGIELPGESPGRLHEVADWSLQTQPSLAFGYEIGVTVLQMASALAVVANDGVRVPPRVTLGLRDSGGRVRMFERPKPRRVLDSRTVRELTAMMEGVVERGSGTLARIPGYRIAGKSGTARKLIRGRYSDHDFVASFGGFAPISSPRLVALVVVDGPRGRHYGGEVAAPVFRRILDDALRYLRAPRDAGAVTLAGIRRAASADEGGAAR
jgi:cell division protein FtsI/penicillin-binding protein 2